MKICVVTNQHVSYNPRVVKEADALAEFGHSVTVLAVKNSSELSTFDQDSGSHPWTLETVDYRPTGFVETWRWLKTAVRKRAFDKVISRFTMSGGVAELAHGRVHTELCRLACRHPADLYIAHHVEALGAAYQAARRHGARFAFDAEDFHSGELPDGTNTRQTARVEFIEAKYLPLCDYVTAASSCIAQAISEKYHMRCPEVIDNVFPLQPLHSERGNGGKQKGGGISLYWYSQVIGPGRGLEQTVSALNRIAHPCQLHLRGTLMDGFREKLRELARDLPFEQTVFFHSPAAPHDLIDLAAEHDVGLALETGECRNRLLCVTNKIFVYMLAGLAVVATDTPGQLSIVNQAPDSAVVCKKNDVDSLVSAIEFLIANPNKLEQAKRASRKAAEQRFNWDIEKEKLFRLVDSCLGNL